MLLFFLEALHGALCECAAAGGGAEGVAAGEGVLGQASTLVAGMLLRQQGLGALGLEAAVEEVCAELEDVVGLVL